MNDEERAYNAFRQAKAVRIVNNLEDALYDILVKHGASKGVIDDMIDIIHNFSIDMDNELL